MQILNSENKFSLKTGEKFKLLIILSDFCNLFLFIEGFLWKAYCFLNQMGLKRFFSESSIWIEKVKEAVYIN